MIEVLDPVSRSWVYSLSAFRMGSSYNTMNIQAPIFCCPSAEQCGQTHESLGRRLEPFMKWARESPSFQISAATETHFRDCLIEVVKTRQDAPKQPSNRVFGIGNDKDGFKAYREHITTKPQPIHSSALAEECRILVCNECQLSYSVFLFKRRQQTDPPRQ